MGEAIARRVAVALHRQAVAPAVRGGASHPHPRHAGGEGVDAGQCWTPHLNHSPTQPHPSTTTDTWMKASSLAPSLSLV